MPSRTLALLAAVGFLASVGGTRPACSQTVPFLAYGASASSQEVVAVRFETQRGKLTPRIVQTEPLGCEGAPVAFHPRYRLLYVASLRAAAAAENQLVAFSVNDQGRLQEMGRVPLAHGSAYLSFDRTGNFLLSASYFDGHVDVYRVDDRGLPTASPSTTYEGRDKAHSVLTDGDNRFVYVPYVKDQNALFQYGFDQRNGQLKPLDPPRANLPPGVGPRHVTYHPNKPWVYFSNEQQLGVTAYRIGGNGQLSLLHVCEPGDLKPAPGVAASDIAMTPDGRFLYVGVRDFERGVVDAVHGYQVQDDGRLTHLTKTDSDAIPWGLQMAPDGRHLLVTAARGKTLTAFEVDPAGRLQQRASIPWGEMIRDIAVVVCE